MIRVARNDKITSNTKVPFVFFQIYLNINKFHLYLNLHVSIRIGCQIRLFAILILNVLEVFTGSVNNNLMVSIG